MKDLFILALQNAGNGYKERADVNTFKGSVWKDLKKVRPFIYFDQKIVLSCLETIISIRELGEFKGDIKLVFYGDLLPEFFVDICNDLNVEILRRDEGRFNIYKPSQIAAMDSTWYRFLDYSELITPEYRNVYAIDCDMWVTKPISTLKILEMGILFNSYDKYFPYMGFSNNNKDVQFFMTKLSELKNRYGEGIIPMPSFLCGKASIMKERLDKYIDYCDSPLYYKGWGIDTFIFTHSLDLDNDFVDTTLEADSIGALHGDKLLIHAHRNFHLRFYHYMKERPERFAKYYKYY